MSDSQCDGELAAEEADYTVTWIAHPVVKLSSDTKVKYEKYNGSFIHGEYALIDVIVDGC